MVDLIDDFEVGDVVISVLLKMLLVFDVFYDVVEKFKFSVNVKKIF